MVDDWADGSCYNKVFVSAKERTGLEAVDRTDYNIEKGIKYCSKQGFPYAALTESRSGSGKTQLFCDNTRLGLSSLFTLKENSQMEYLAWNNLFRIRLRLISNAY